MTSLNLQSIRSLFTVNRAIFSGILAAKLILLVLFSSDYQDLLFIPFVKHFTTHFDNPWNYFAAGNWPEHLPSPFPYPPLMLYILSAVYWPYEAAGLNFAPLLNLMFKLPTLVADLGIVYLLRKLYVNRGREILIYYFASPIVIYAAYIHSQLDLIPTAMLFASAYFLIKNRLLWSAVLFGLALSVKLHVLAALPLMGIYLYRNRNLRSLLPLLVIPVLCYFLFSFNFLFTDGYRKLVLLNEQQSKLYDVYFSIGDLRVILPVLAVAVLYARFLVYPKTNKDLLFGFLGGLFSVFVLLVPPSPAWYVWTIPYLTIFFINAGRSRRKPPALSLFLGLSAFYLIYFVFFHIPEVSDLNFLGNKLDLKLDIKNGRHLSFTFLAGALIAMIYVLYKYGIRSNAIYKRGGATVIGIAGDSSAGKSTILADLRGIFGDERMVELEGDGEHKWERGDGNWKYYSHLHPKANFLYKQAEHVINLKHGHPVERVEYDHGTGKFTRPTRIMPRDFVVLCGLHSFYLPKLRREIDLKIYLDTQEELRRYWKVERDTKKRGYTPEQVVRQIESRETDARKFIYPQRPFADLIVRYFRDQEDERIKLMMTVDVNANLDQLVLELQSGGVSVIHDYEEDVRHQFLILEGSLDAGKVREIAERIIVNLDEITDPDRIAWREDYRGFAQVMILLMLSEVWKSRDDDA